LSVAAAEIRTGGEPRVALRPVALPTEHGGWGFLFEPLVLGLAVAPSWAGLLIAFAAIFGFLTRQPLKFAMQDALRRKRYPRTRVCWRFATIYASGAAVAVAMAAALHGWRILVPFAAVAPLAIVALVADARNQSRALLPELAGAIAMTSTAASIAIAGGRSWTVAFTLVALLVARGVPSILYVRALLQRAHGKMAAGWPSIALHVLAIIAGWFAAGWIAALAMTILLVRAVWGVTHEVPRAKTVGWREIAYGTLTVALLVVATA
jgi:hypothetical protein